MDLFHAYFMTKFPEYPKRVFAIGAEMEDERTSAPENKAEIASGIGRLPRVYSSFEKPVAFRTVLLSINDLMKKIYNKVAYRFPIFTQGNIADVNEGSSSFNYFALVDSGQYLPCKIKNEDYDILSLEENLPVIVKGYFNLESPLNRPYAFEIRLNVIELSYKPPDSNAETPDQVSKKPVPEKIQSVCLITSPNSEAISDFHEGLKKTRRHLKIEIQSVNLLNPGSISAGIKEADAKGYDMLVITRGGGQDLYLFNDPVIVEAVAACKTFTITGIGHANNKTECDRVSDLSVETPTSAGVHIGRLVGAKFYTGKNKVLSPHSSIQSGRPNPRIIHLRRFLEYAGVTVLAFVVFIGQILLNIGKRILLLGLTLLAGLLVLLIISLLLRGCG